MKYVNNLILAGLLISVTGHAAPLLIDKDYSGNRHDLSEAMIIIHALSNHPAFGQLIEKDYVGSSVNAPCSDLKNIDRGTHQTLLANFDNANLKLTSAKLVSNFGTALTCIRSDFVMTDSHVFSTGNIQLVWDENSKTYTAATPNQLTIDFSY